MRSRLTAVLASSLVCVVVLVAPAYAAFPGANGKIAFSSDRDGNLEIYTMNADGTGQTRLTNNAAFDEWPTWSPDGTKIAFSSTRDGNHEIYTMNADGTGQTRLTNNAAFDFYPAWSPDGTKIAFSSTRDGNHDIYTMNADGTGHTRLTNDRGSDADPAWSPDGTKIAFYSTRDDNVEIYTMNADGTGQTRLTNNAALDWYPAWSPDGTKIAFAREGQFGEIYTMNADGTGQTNITNNGVSDSMPAWSPDGTQIAFASWRDRVYGPGQSPPPIRTPEIYVMNADGSAQTRLTIDPAWDGFPDWQPLVGPNRADYKNAAKFCTADREFLGEDGFRQKYGGGANAHGKCVSGK